MTARKFVKMNMYRTVQQLCDANMGIISKNVGFMQAYNKFIGNLQQIEAAASGAGTVTTGITADKNVDKDNLCQTATTIAGYVFAYASTVNNNTLKASVDVSYTYLHELKKEELLTVATNVYAIATDNVAKVADFGATPEALANFDAELKAYKISVNRPRLAQTTKGTHNENLDNLFKAEETILTEQMDKVVMVFNKDFPDFVTAYGKARIVVDGPTGGDKVEVTPTA